MSQFGSFLKDNGIPTDGFETNFASLLANNGWFMFASGWGGFMPKMHQERCVLLFNNWSADVQFEKMAQMKENKALVKKVKKYLYNEKGEQFILSLNTNFQEAMDKTNEFQKIKNGCTWVEPRLIDILMDIAQNPYVIDKTVIQGMSWELRLKSNNQLISADIGYSVGGIYTSMTGFSDRKYSSIGTIHLLAQGQALKNLGFNMWDFGMEMKYKKELGSQIFKRTDFLLRQKIAKMIKVKLLNEESKKLNFEPVNIMQSEICGLQKLKLSYFKTEQLAKNKFKYQKDIKQQFKEIENISVDNWEQQQLQKWLDLRFNKDQNKKLYDFSQVDNLNRLQNPEEFIKVLKSKSLCKRVQKIFNAIKQKQNKNNNKNNKDQ
ncbi:Acyl-CoA N-acyltransferase [Pseudocohnilembus persalinus]|uniref:Acyl-CoA N-acyltransferase n=1 Tax=Pseudocohnilembus persalinus TaxID=266149 RepID=A0A0V0QBV4_PSEPJ|nr:Acyl-CoA N-acyltransferase [Pseudocohnilembus persalinus]|eukprot:KRW99615.1 Acyl-CoA N-acyltransferase [Pseudocohnilembus persalinus]